MTSLLCAVLAIGGGFFVALICMAFYAAVHVKRTWTRKRG